MAAQVFTPYSTVSPFFAGSVGWVPPEDADRVMAYQTYQEIYWSNPQSFKLVSRGNDEQPIYLPSGKIIVNTVARYTAKGFKISITPDMGTPEQQATAAAAFGQLFARERFYARFGSQKKQGLINGDWLWHIRADASKLPGQRISIKFVDPGAYFPRFESDIVQGGDPDKIVKVHLAEQFIDKVQNKTFVRRQTYEKTDTGVLSSMGVFEVKEWWLSDSPVQVILPPTLLPPQITQIPVYHVRNLEEDGNPFGSSELRGIEIVQAAINQAASDEDIALALEGLGLYRTSSGKPVDENGDEVDWIIGPGRVVNAENFDRVGGIGSVTPYLDHINMLASYLYESAAASDAARGKIDVTVAESGISLALQLGPMVARVEDSNRTIYDTHAQMFFDLKAWLQAYEGIQIPDVEVLPQFGNPLPTNVKEVLANVVMMMSTTPPLLSATTGREMLAEAGVHFAPDELARISQESALTATLDTSATAENADPFAARAAQDG
jgi:hypothetical protein